MIQRLRAPVHTTISRALGDRAPGVLASWYESTIGRIHYTVDPAARESAKRLACMRDAYRGKRCFILGNGPSLASMDLSPLRNEFTFGLNRIYLMFEKLGFNTTFLVVVNSYVIEQCAEELRGKSQLTFVPWQYRNLLHHGAAPLYYRQVHKPGFSADPIGGLWSGATVTYVAMQLAYFLGFSEVVLIGVDHHFETQGPPGKVISASGADPNHFDPSYFSNGFRWQLPDLETSEYAYSLARQAFEADGRKMYNATVGGRLEVLPRRPFESFFPVIKAA